MLKNNVSFGICLSLFLVLLSRVDYCTSDGSAHCKELNHVACYAGQNEGYFCSKKDQTKSVARWFYDKGTCRQFEYKGCYGNRNRFCTKDECEKRCEGYGDGGKTFAKSLSLARKIKKLQS